MSPPPIGGMGRWLNDFGGTISGPGSSAPIVPPPPEPDSIIRRVIDAGQSLVRWPARFTQAAPQLLLNSITTRDGQMEIARRMAEGIRFRIGTQDDFEYFVRFLRNTANTQRRPGEIANSHRAHALYTLLSLRTALIARIENHYNVVFHLYREQSRDAIQAVESAIREVNLENVFGTQGEWIPSVEDPDALRFFECLRDLARTNDEAMVFVHRFELKTFFEQALFRYYQVVRGAGSSRTHQILSDRREDGHRPENRALEYLKIAQMIRRLDADLDLGMARNFSEEDRRKLSSYLFVNADARFDDGLPERDLLAGVLIAQPEGAVAGEERPVANESTVRAIIRRYQTRFDASISPDDVVTLSNFLVSRYEEGENVVSPTDAVGASVLYFLNHLGVQDIEHSDRDVYLKALRGLALAGNDPARLALFENARVDVHSFLELVNLYQEVTADPNRYRHMAVSQVTFHLITSDRSFFDVGLRTVSERMRPTLQRLNRIAEFAEDYRAFLSRQRPGKNYGWVRSLHAYPAGKFIEIIENASLVFNERLRLRIDPSSNLDRNAFSNEDEYQSALRASRLTPVTQAEITSMLEDVFRDQHFFPYIAVQAALHEVDVSNPNAGETDWIVSLASRDRSAGVIPVRSQPIQPGYAVTLNSYEAVILSYLGSDGSRRELVDSIVRPLGLGRVSPQDIFQIIDFLVRLQTDTNPATASVRIQALETLLLLKGSVCDRPSEARGATEAAHRAIDAVVHYLDAEIARMNPYHLVGGSRESLPDLLSEESAHFLRAMRSFAFLNSRADQFLRSFDWNVMLRDLASQLRQLSAQHNSRVRGILDRATIEREIRRGLEVVQEIFRLDEARGLGIRQGMTTAVRADLDAALLSTEVQWRNIRTLRLIEQYRAPGASPGASIEERPVLDQLSQGSIEPYELRLVAAYVRQENRAILEMDPNTETDAVLRRGERLEQVLADLEMMDINRLRRGSYIDMVTAFRILSGYGNLDATENLVWNAQHDVHAFEEALQVMADYRAHRRTSAVSGWLHYHLLIAPESLYHRMESRPLRDESFRSLLRDLHEERQILSVWLDCEAEYSPRITGPEIPISTHYRAIPIRQNLQPVVQFLEKLRRTKEAIHEVIYRRENPREPGFANERRQNIITQEIFERRVLEARRPLTAEERVGVIREVAPQHITNEIGSLMASFGTEARVQRRAPVITTAPARVPTARLQPLSSEGVAREVGRESAPRSWGEVLQRALEGSINPAGREGVGGIRR